jgi:hypothetical protein
MDKMVSKDAIDLINTGERDGYNTAEHLRNARQQAVDRGFDKMTIIDVGCRSPR